jgi:hypothetical protein
MKKYFVAKEGIQKGPWTLDEITQNIQSKVLSWNDYIYDENINVWLFLFEFPSLTESFNSSFKNPLQKSKIMTDFDIFTDRVWSILKANENYGPFSTFEMLQMLQSGTLFEYDFVWRPDQSSWKRISDVNEFKPEKIKELFEVSSEEKNEIQKTFFRRRFPRAEYKSELLIHDHKKVYSAESIEISAGGASFKLDNANFAIGDQVYLHFKPGGDVPAFNATCKIVSQSANMYGVSFLIISSSVKEQLDKYTKKIA